MKTKFVLTIVFCSLSKIALAQTFTASISSSVSSSQLACINDPVTYTLSTNIPSAVCSVTWSITAGSGTYVTGFGPTSNPTKIRWADQKPNKGTVNASVKYILGTATCSNGAEYASVSRSTIIRSVFGEPLEGVVSPRDVSLCGTQVLPISVNPLYIKNTGSGTSIPLTQVERYQWILPAGWRQAGTTNTGTILTSTSNISIEPQNLSGTCSLAGQVRVMGVAAGFSQCGGTPQSVSNQSSINLTRSPAFNITAAGGFTTQTCGKRATVTFTATSIPCATSYSWSYTGGWTGPATTTSNSVTASPIKPDNTTVNTAGSITGVANLSVGGCGVSKTLNIPYSNTVPNPTFVFLNPVPFELCQGDGPVRILVSVPGGYDLSFGYDYYATGGILIGSSSYSTSAPYHTNSNLIGFDIAGAYGTQSLGVRLNNTVCPPSNYVSVTKKVGPYSNSEFYIVGNSGVCPNNVASFSSSISGTGGITGYDWIAPSGASSSGNGTPYFNVSVPTPFFGGAVLLRLQNRCGWTNTPYALNLFNACGGFMVSPNPTSDEVVVSEVDPKQETTIALVDKNNNTQRIASGKADRFVLDVRDLPNGLYVLQFKQKEHTDTQQVMISH